MSVTLDLTVRQIQALAEFAGLTVTSTNSVPMDRKYTITDNPPQPSMSTGLVAYTTEIPSESGTLIMSPL